MVPHALSVVLASCNTSGHLVLEMALAVKLVTVSVMRPNAIIMRWWIVLAGAITKLVS